MKTLWLSKAEGGINVPNIRLYNIPPSQLPKGLKNNILLKDTIVAWQLVRRELKLPTTISMHLPILGNPQFPQGGLHQV